MNDFLNSVKADLLDRRILPLVALVAVALLAAIGYAAFGGGSSSSTSAPAVVPGAPVALGGAGISVTQPQTSAGQAVAETTNGTSTQRHGLAHNPFAALPSAATATGTVTGTAVNSGKAASGGSAGTKGSSGSSSGASTPTTPTAPATPAKPTPPVKPKPAYSVSAMFGVVPPAGTPPPVPPLTPYEGLKLQTPLPATQPVVIYRGVTTGGKSAAFTIYGEVIIHGQGVCMPNTAQCTLIDLKPGQSETFEYLPPSGTPVLYELKIVKISLVKAATAALSALHVESKAGRELLRRAGLQLLPGMHYSKQAGVIALNGHKPFAASSRVGTRGAVRRARHSG
jgi:hypothetical protein